jgi:hypothetical protein
MDEHVPDERQSPGDSSALLIRIEHEWRVLQDAVASCDRAKLGSHPPGAWSIKDHLAHLSAWERFLCLYHLGDLPAHEAMGVDEATYRGLDEDGVNAVLYTRNKERSLEGIQADLRRSHAEVLDRIREIPFDMLLGPRFPEDPDVGLRLRWVMGNTCEHYREHRVAIEQLARWSAGEAEV